MSITRCPSGRRRWPDLEAAQTSKRFLAGGQAAGECPYGCKGFHLAPEAKPAAARVRSQRQRKPIPQVSRKRAAQNRERRAMVQRLYPERPLCAVWLARVAIGLPPLPDCTRWADDLHEPLSRARGGGISDEENQLPPCRPCHDVLTFTPESELAWAYDLGLLKKSGRPSKAIPREAA